MSSEIPTECCMIISRCPCGLHAYIKLPDGYQSYDFFSCEDGLRIANGLFHTGRITEQEFKNISAKIAGIIFLGEKVFTQLRNLMNQIEDIHGPSAIMTETITKIMRDSINSFSCEFSKKIRSARSKKETETDNRRVLH